MLPRSFPVWRALRSTRYRDCSKAKAAPKAVPRTAPKTARSSPETTPKAAPETDSKAAAKTEPRVASETAPQIPTYHPKVRAIPFAFPPEKAIREAGVATSLLGYTYDASQPNVHPLQIISSVLAKYLPITGCKPLQPTRIQALYFPTWFADAELEANACFTSPQDEDRKSSYPAVVQIENVYLPGFGMDFGRVLIRDPPKDYDLAQPFTPDLIKQWGQDVMCLPFNTLPFDIIELAQQDLRYSDAVINEHVRFIRGSSIKTNLAAAYPVLLPVYLLQYVSREPWPPITVIMAAHSNSAVFHIHIPHDPDSKTLKLPFEKYFEGADYIEGHVPGDDTDVLATVINRPQATEPLSAWLYDKLHERDAPVAMASRARDIKMDDLRIREWTKEEVQPVHAWMQTGRVIQFVHGWLKQIDDTSSSVNPEGKKALEALHAFFRAEAEKVHKLEEARAKQLPDWWPQWIENAKARHERGERKDREIHEERERVESDNRDNLEASTERRAKWAERRKARLEERQGSRRKSKTERARRERRAPIAS